MRNLFTAISSVFGCSHPRFSRPFTIQNQSYMVCLDCGHQEFYSMDEWRRLSRREVRRMRVAVTSPLPLAVASATDVEKDAPLAA